MSKIKMLAITMLAIFTIGAWGCMSNSNSEAANKYLEEKYHDSFELSNKDSQPIMSTYRNFDFCDKNGNTFTVKYDDQNKEFSDNYLAFIFDKELKQNLSNVFGANYRINVSTKDKYTNKDSHYSSLDKYLRDVSIIVLDIYTSEKVDYHDVANKIIQNCKDCIFSVRLGFVSSNDLDNIRDNANENSKLVNNKKIFKVKNNKIDEAN